MRRAGKLFTAALVLAIAGGLACAATYEIGPGKTCENIGDYPWENPAAVLFPASARRH